MRWKHQFGEVSKGKTVFTRMIFLPPAANHFADGILPHLSHSGMAHNGSRQRCDLCRCPGYATQLRVPLDMFVRMHVFSEGLSLDFTGLPGGRCLQTPRF